MSHVGKEACPPGQETPARGLTFASIVVFFILLVIIGAVIVRPY
ncbi:YjcZ family sporulation protein [Evansella cellulosilytica]|uniref:YjcZ family sporulation protein n=1 Tax=Evansella cellulosilytica (strain ATCC 21833 / DSM 2522 / FERM P-1141 / JCM 9156 / N-4) TaxID=649639 RepID=E6TQJ9_EVAC2|nr:YjcZ family sporulation protein [Evansella cellulosilytica]ADU30510.1 hypothetical protein Bcell_2250 [Evansella cellulosilytica DSM 2522]